MAKPKTDVSGIPQLSTIDLSNETSPSQSDKSSLSPPTVVKCWTGSLMGAVIAYGCYQMTVAIATTYAAKPLLSHSVTTLNIAVAVRTLVVGICALGTGVFGLSALGLFALGIQILWRRASSHPPSLSGR